jgi:hypothetical protein
MINPKELAICKRRGHSARLLGDGWAQCKWCGTWIREVRTIEEREDAPPESQLGLLTKIDARQVDQPKQKWKKKKGKK